MAITDRLREIDWRAAARQTGAFLQDPLGSQATETAVVPVTPEVAMAEIERTPPEVRLRLYSLGDLRDARGGNAPLFGFGGARRGLLSRDLAICDSAIHAVTQHIAQAFAAVAFDGLSLVHESSGKTVKKRGNGPGMTLSMLKNGADSVLGDAYSFWETMAFDLLFDGNAYYEIVGGPRGGVTELRRLDPRLVHIRVTEHGVMYDGSRWDGTRVHLTSNEIVHIANARMGGTNFGYGSRNYGFPGTNRDGVETLFTGLLDVRVGTTGGLYSDVLRGTAPLRALSAVIDVNQAGEEHVRSFFTGAAARSNTLILVEGEADDPWLDSLSQRIARGGPLNGANGRAPDVVGWGERIKEVVQLKNEAQNRDLKELREYGVQEVCRHFNYPQRFQLPGNSPAKTLEADQRMFWLRCVKPMADRVASAMTRALLRDGLAFRFDEKVLLRADLTAYANFIRATVGGSQNTGVISTDEARELLRYEPTGDARDKRVARPEDFQNTGAPPGRPAMLPEPKEDGEDEPPEEGDGGENAED